MIPLAAEAKAAVAAVSVIAVVLHVLLGFAFALPVWGIVILMLLVFRDFSRVAPTQPLACISPADGQVLGTGIERDPFLNREALRIRLRQSRLGEFNLHSPVEGEIEKRWSKRAGDQGMGGVKITSRAIAIWLQTDEKDDVVVAVDLGSPLRVTLLRIQPGERVGHGQRCGVVGFGRPIDVYLPPSSQCKVKPGQHLKAGSDIIAKLRPTTQP